MRILFCLVSLLVMTTSWASEINYGNAIVANVTSIYDGDTFRVNIDGWPAIVGSRIPIRVAGIDTPELRGKCEEEIKLARRAKAYTVAALRGAKKIELKNMRRGKYFRVIADVFIDDDSLGDMLIREKLGYRYYGGIKKLWC